MNSRAIVSQLQQEWNGMTIHSPLNSLTKETNTRIETSRFADKFSNMMMNLLLREYTVVTSGCHDTELWSISEQHCSFQTPFSWYMIQADTLAVHHSAVLLSTLQAWTVANVYIRKHDNDYTMMGCFHTVTPAVAVCTLVRILHFESWVIKTRRLCRQQR